MRFLLWKEMFSGEGYDAELLLQNYERCPVGRRLLEAPEDTSLSQERGTGLCPGKGQYRKFSCTNRVAVRLIHPSSCK